MQHLHTNRRLDTPHVSYAKITYDSSHRIHYRTATHLLQTFIAIDRSETSVHVYFSLDRFLREDL